MPCDPNVSDSKASSILLIIGSTVSGRVSPSIAQILSNADDDEGVRRPRAADARHAAAITDGRTVTNRGSERKREEI